MRRMHNRRMAEPVLNLSPSPGDEVKTTTCYMCACRCGIKVWLQDGQIRFLGLSCIVLGLALFAVSR